MTNDDMNRREHRKLRPHERARQDQMEARAADLTKSAPMVVAVVYPDPGQYRCCWCSCAEPHNGPCAAWCTADAF